jgi:hypothetical protein
MVRRKPARASSSQSVSVRQDFSQVREPGPLAGFFRWGYELTVALFHPWHGDEETGNLDGEFSRFLEWLFGRIQVGFRSVCASSLIMSPII